MSTQELAKPESKQGARGSEEMKKKNEELKQTVKRKIKSEKQTDDKIKKRGMILYSCYPYAIKH